MKSRSETIEISGGVLVEAVVYGSDGDYVCRLSRMDAQTQNINDAFVPPSEIGALWLRQCENKWLISGLVKKVDFPHKRHIYDLAYLILEKMLRVKEMAHIKIDRVEYEEAESLHASMEEIDI